MDAKQGTRFRQDKASARQTLPPALLQRFNRLDSVKATASLLETLGVIAACIAICLAYWSPWTVVPAMVLIATRQQALFVLAHDAAHYRFYANRRLNDGVGRLCASLLGISMDTYRVVHRLHHNHLYQRQDPDIPLHGGYPRGRLYLIRKLVTDLFGVTAYKTYRYFFGAPALNIDGTGPSRPLDDTAPQLRQAARVDRWRVVGLHVALPAIAVLAGFGWEYLLLWLLPLVSLLQPILRLRAICEHGAVRDTANALTAARTNLGPRWWLWLFFPHHVNYHIEHHLYPAVPHYHLPALHRALTERGLLQGAEVRQFGDTMAAVFTEPTRKSEAAAA